jgi:hypothetical protein
MTRDRGKTNFILLFGRPWVSTRIGGPGAEQSHLLRPQAQPSHHVPRNAAQPMPPGYNANLPNGAFDHPAAPAAAPKPQPPPLTDTERAANAIGKVAREVGELEPQVTSSFDFSPTSASPPPSACLPEQLPFSPPKKSSIDFPTTAFSVLAQGPFFAGLRTLMPEAGETMIWEQRRCWSLQNFDVFDN